MHTDPPEKPTGNAVSSIPEPNIIAYNIREEERPAGIKIRWKWRIVTGRQAEALEARQAEVIERILQWQYDRKHSSPET